MDDSIEGLPLQLSNKTALAMIFKLAQAAEKSWRRLKGKHPVKLSITHI
jgi:hypothetical protein